MMDSPSLEATRRSHAIADFRTARKRAKLKELLARIKREPVGLLGFEDVRQKLQASVIPLKVLREIPVDAIVGSVNRYEDFTRDFLPRDNIDEQRWANVVVASQGSLGLPPIEVYQIGEAYFVSDGNHRVSVARQYGAGYIQAYVTEVQSRVPLSPENTPNDIILKSEYVSFLEKTNLDQLFPEADFSVSVPGQYPIIEEHISVHRYYMGIERKHEIPYVEAVIDWYEMVYMPVVRLIQGLGLLRDFPERTETDLYLWLSEYRSMVEKQFGLEVEAEKAAVGLVNQFGTRLSLVLKRSRERLLDRILPDALEGGPPSGTWRTRKKAVQQEDCLFSDILVPVSGGEAGWQALEQAIQIATQEGARLHGLYVVRNKKMKESAEAEQVQAEFAHRCNEAGVAGKLVIGSGKIARQITERAVWNDLVVVNLSYPPGPKLLARLSSGFRIVLQRSPVPVLAVPQAAIALERVLLAYDDSPKAREAMYITAYLAAQWNSQVSVVCAKSSQQANQDALFNARLYLESQHVEANYISEVGPSAKIILEAAAAEKTDLVLMGGYRQKPLIQAIRGSTVDQVLREIQTPLLVCR